MAINSSNISLELAHRLTDVVNAAWKSGEMLEKVTPTTASLLNYWFGVNTLLSIEMEICFC